MYVVIVLMRKYTHTWSSVDYIWTQLPNTQLLKMSDYLTFNLIIKWPIWPDYRLLVQYSDHSTLVSKSTYNGLTICSSIQAMTWITTLIFRESVHGFNYGTFKYQITFTIWTPERSGHWLELNKIQTPNPPMNVTTLPIL